jgi:vitamin B12 transporter
MKTIAQLSTLAAIFAVSSTSLANDKLEEIVITSSRIEMPLRKIGTSVSVITQQEIQDRGFSSLVDVLRSQPAVSVSNTGGAGKATSLRIRGEAGYRTLVLLDGIDITDTTGTQASPRWEHLQSAGISRVEILRGPQGLMYGADAGGVVNIQSRAPEQGLGGELSAEAGRYDTQLYTAHLGGGTESVDFSLSASDFDTGGFNSRTTDTVLKDDDGYENTTLHGRVEWNATEKLRFELIAHDVDADNEYDSCFSNTTFENVDDCTDDFSQTSYRGTAELSMGSFSHKLAYSESETEKEFFSEGISSFGAEGELDRFEYLGSWSGNESLRLVYGADFKTESIDDGSVDYDRDQAGYYAEYQGDFGEQLFVTAGVRYDDNDDFGTHTSYRASIAYLVSMSSGEIKLKGSYGTGFRAPSLYEISYNDGPFASPPASETDLSEETTEGFDLGFAYYGNKGAFFEMVYFDQTVEDFIDFDLIDFSGYIQYLGDSSSTGVEVSGDVPVADTWFLTGNYTYNDAEDPDGEQRLRAPKHLANLGISYRPDTALSFTLNIRGSYDAVDGLGVEIDDFEVVDLSARYQLMESLELFGRIENLLDEDYEEVPTYNTSGVAGYAGVRFSF